LIRRISDLYDLIYLTNPLILIRFERICIHMNGKQQVVCAVGVAGRVRVGGDLVLNTDQEHGYLVGVVGDGLICVRWTRAHHAHVEAVNGVEFVTPLDGLTLAVAVTYRR
jgi:hypothetical protein